MGPADVNQQVARLTLSIRSLSTPAQLKQYRRPFFVYSRVISRANVTSSRTIPQVPNGGQTLFGIRGALDALWSGMRTTLNGKEMVVGHENIEFGDINHRKRLQWRTAVLHRFFF
jgi:hypothetical protein